jgi:hypothetical protein
VSTQGLRGGAAHRAVGFLDPLFLVTLSFVYFAKSSDLI